MMALTPEQIKMLNTPLTRDQIATRQAGKGRLVPYLEGFEAIRQAGRVFGHGGWGMTVDDLQFHPMSNGGFYRATVTVLVAGCEPQQDVGGCVAQNDTAEQHDMAFKGAVTDAMKRALRHYGAAFGNDLYSDDAPVAAPAAQAQQQPARAQTQQPARQQPAAQPQPQTNEQADAAALERTADPGLIKLQKQLHEKSQHDQEGKTDLWKYLEDHGKERISELDAAETAEWLMIFNDRAVTPRAAQEVHA